MKIKVFCDFDGTVTKVDVGDKFFETFGDPETYAKLVERWREGKINALEMWSKACETVKVDMDEFEKFVLSQKIDEFFPNFVRFCGSRGIDIFIVSDGFDFYISKILKNYGLDNIKFFSNRFVFDGSEVKPVFPYPDSVCRRCGNCKRNHMLTLSGEDEIIVYIGDGFSDMCPAEYADVVFGKGELYRYCREKNIPVYRFESFKDVMEQFERFLSGRKKLKKRWQAELKRREIFIRE